MMRVRYELVPDSAAWRVWIMDPSSQPWLAGEVYSAASGFSARPRSWTFDRVMRGFPRRRDAAAFLICAGKFGELAPRRAVPGNCGAAEGSNPLGRACPTSQEIKPDVRIPSV